MIELVCEIHERKHGWVQLAVVIPPPEVLHWCSRLHAVNAVPAMWRAAAEVMEATHGRKHWVQEIGNAFAMTYEVKRVPTDRHIIIPTPHGPETVHLVVEVPDGAVRPLSGGGCA